MKRRIFLNNTGIVCLGLSYGLAAINELFCKKKLWKLHPDLSLDMVDHLDEFAKDLEFGLLRYVEDKQLVSDIVSPKTILYSNEKGKGYRVLYENKNGDYIQLIKDKAGCRTGIYNELGLVEN